MCEEIHQVDETLGRQAVRDNGSVLACLHAQALPLNFMLSCCCRYQVRSTKFSKRLSVEASLGGAASILLVSHDFHPQMHGLVGGITIHALGDSGRQNGRCLSFE